MRWPTSMLQPLDECCAPFFLPTKCCLSRRQELVCFGAHALMHTFVVSVISWVAAGTCHIKADQHESSAYFQHVGFTLSAVFSWPGGRVIVYSTSEQSMKHELASVAPKVSSFSLMMLGDYKHRL